MASVSQLPVTQATQIASSGDYIACTVTKVTKKQFSCSSRFVCLQRNTKVREKEKERKGEEYLTNCVSRNLCSDERGQRFMEHRESGHGFKFCDRNLTQENNRVCNRCFKPFLSTFLYLQSESIIFISMNILLIHNGNSVFRKFVSEICI